MGLYDGAVPGVRRIQRSGGCAGNSHRLTAFRRGERWAWWTLLVANVIAYGSAMSYDRVVNAIGPFEMMEYAGLAAVFAALAVKAPFRSAEQLAQATG